MPTTHTPQAVKPRFRKTLLALAASAALLPQAAPALDLTQAPPATVEPYVAPNVILSLDDSGSMGTAMPDATGKSSTRAAILQQAVIDVFSDTNLLPDGKIRLAWQTYNGASACNTYLTAGDAQSTTKQNVMHVLAGPVGTAQHRDTTTSRGKFLACMDSFKGSGSTPTHKMMWAARQYMAGTPLNQNSPWASVPGTTGSPYLACRRNYHILLTDGGWNLSAINTPDTANSNPANYDGNPHDLPDGTHYPGNNESATNADNQIFRDKDPATTTASYTVSTPGTATAPNSGVSSIADWAMYSWATELQKTSTLDQLQPNGTAVPLPQNYIAAADTNTYTDRVTKVTATLKKYWDPNFDPATWPHLQTYTIGFSDTAVPHCNYKLSGTTYTVQNPNTYVAPTSMLPYGTDGSFAEYVNGTFAWYAVGAAVKNGCTTGNDYDQRGLDMWHAAINGRGQFYSVVQGADLKLAFQTIIGNIVVSNEPKVSSMAASGFNSSRTDVGTFIAGYDPINDWAGYVKSMLIKTDGTSVAAWGGQTTAQKLDAIPYSTTPPSRVVLTWSNKWNGSSSSFTGGAPFVFSNLSPEQEDLLNVGGGGDDRVQYLRGNRAKEAQNGGTFRNRTSAQGDIVNSGVWYTGVPASLYSMAGYSNFVSQNSIRMPMIYVGGNDGMLHGFSAADGSEKIAYVPRGVIPTLSQLTDPTYSHLYYVDGSPMTGDVNFVGGGTDSSYQVTVGGGGASDWRTVLVGTLGAGGRGYFVLDVTDPGSFSEPHANSLVLTDRTRGNNEAQATTCPNTMSGGSNALTACNDAWVADQDLGNITAGPVLDDVDGLRTTQIALMNNNRWAVVLGNGYNSPNHRPVLLIQYLDATTGQLGSLKTIPATTDAPGVGMAYDNGLAAPRLVDVNGDGRPDVAYAGDNQGNLWKFDLTSSNDSQWGVAFDNHPLFTATGPSVLGAAQRTVSQPISAAPTVRANDRKMDINNDGIADTAVGGMMVVFGTGRNVATNDDVSTAVQTLYSVLDNTRYSTNPNPNPNLGPRVQVAPAQGSNPSDPNYVPAPAYLGTVATANLAQQTITNATGNYASVTPVTDLNQSTWFGRNGWYLDFPDAGERLLQSIQFYDGSNILSVYSEVPPKGALDGATTTMESCQGISVSSGTQYLTFINIMDGKAPTVQLVDVNGDGQYNSADGGASRIREGDFGPKTQTAFGSGKMNERDTKGYITNVFRRMPIQSLRPSWRQWQ